MDSSRIPARYRVIQEVGQGGMAVVYRAQDQALKREVAIKILHMHLSGEPESKARLEREAQAVAKLRHENILEIFDYSGRDAASPFIVTEFIDGETLKQFLARRPVAFPEVSALIAAQIAGALAHAHALGIIHRDVKPENVMIRRDGVLKLTDFGIAQLVDLQRMTVTGQLLGSPAYMAPELIDGRPLDFRTDVFSVGVLLYQLATGELPFSGKNPHEVLKRIAGGRFTDPRSLCRLIGDGLHRIISRALARDPDGRYASMAGLGEDLTEYAAEAGLGDARRELKAFFADPAEYEQSLPARLAAGLLTSARSAVERGRILRALELLNRLLALQPQHADALKLLRRLETRRRVRAAGLVLVGALVTAVVAFSVSRLPRSAAPASEASVPAGQSQASATPDAMPAQAPPALGGTARAPLPMAAAIPVAAESTESALVQPATADRAAAVRRAAASNRHAVARPPARPTSVVAGLAGGIAPARGPRQIPPPEIAAGPPPSGPEPVKPSQPKVAPIENPTRTFVLGPTPQNVDVSLDGKKLFAYGPEHKTITVPWNGNHVIELRSPSGCCFVERVEVGPDYPIPPDNVIARRLAWRPARLVVTSDPPVDGARVMVVDARGGLSSVTQLGEDVDIKLGTSDDGRKEVEVVVDTGDRFLLVTERVTVHAGRTTTHVVKLKAAK